MHWCRHWGYSLNKQRKIPATKQLPSSTRTVDVANYKLCITAEVEGAIEKKNRGRGARRVWVCSLKPRGQSKPHLEGNIEIKT